MNKLLVALLILALAFSGCAAPATPSPTAPATLAPSPDAAATAAALQATFATQSASATQSALVQQTAAVAQTSAALQTLTAAQTAAAQATRSAVKIEDVIAFEMKGAFNFFWEQANTDPASPGYGLIRDRFPGSEGIASMASVGFGLTAYLVGIEKGYITSQQGSERVSKTLDTLLKMDREHGFYYHFVDQKSGKRAWNSEVSSIDSSILLMGVLSAGQYFGGEIQAKAAQIYAGVDWPWFLDPAKNMFYMAYRPEKGFEGHWDFYAEQLMMYVLAAGSSTHPLSDAPYYTFTRHTAKYGDGVPFVHSWFGSIFTYQYSHAWIDFKGTSDLKQVNWFDNSVAASLAQVQFATDMQSKFKTLGPQSWGLTASDGPGGYNGLYGAPPSGFDDSAHVVDGTLAPSGAIGSIIFLPEQAQQAMLNYYSLEKLKSRYGFIDAYNLDKDWYDSDVIGIDKGISLLMLANFENNFVHQVMMKNTAIIKGMDRLGIKKSG